MKKKLIIIIISVLILIGAACLSFPAISNLINDCFNKSKIDSYNNNVNSSSQEEIDKLYESAKKYNEAVASKYFSSDYSSKYNEILSKYNDIMNFCDGLICYIEIPKINIKLPVYHGSEEVLKKGAAHLEQTSFPIGGNNTHACISAHSGYPTQKFFDDINELQSGDMIYIHILNQTLSYKVYKTDIVLPDDTEQLNIVSNEDLITLVTCYPYGINSHRLIVHAERTYDIQSDKKDNNNDSVPTKTLPMLLFCLIFLPVGTFSVFYIIKRKTKKLNAGEL